jgi:ribosome-associated translation inhibitor RaiA
MVGSLADEEVFAMSRRHMVPTGEVEVIDSAQIPAELADYAREKVTKLGRYTAQPILRAQIRLTTSPDPAVARPARATANVDVNGWLLHGDADAVTPREAVDLLHAQLRRRLSRAQPHWRVRRRREIWLAGRWRQGVSTRRHPRYFRRSQERQIVPRRAYEPPRSTVDEAVFDMDLFGYDFHLFTDEHTGQEAVVYRAGPTGYRLARSPHGDAPAPQTAFALTMSPDATPRLTAGQAVDRLILTGQHFVFYTDANTGRGHLVYHRNDGHCGLIGAPAAPDRP